MRTFFQTPGTRWVAYILGALLLIMTVPSVASADEVVGTVIIAAFIISLVWFYWFRVARLGVRLEENVIVVVNPLKTHRLRTSEIRKFYCGRWHAVPTVIVQLCDGKEIGALGILIGGAGPDERTKEMVEQLNRYIKERSS